MAAKNHDEFCKSMHLLTTGNCHMLAECEECKEIWNAAIAAEALKPSHNSARDAICVNETCSWNLNGVCGMARACPGRNK
jgi:hypothetical protein